MMYYCSLADAKSELNAKDAVQNPALLKNILQASSRFDIEMSGNARRPFFGPYLETRKFRLSADNVSSLEQTFRLPIGNPLLSYSALLVGSNSIVGLSEGYPQSVSPFAGIRLTSFEDWYGYANTSTSLTYISITGVWGYHSDYSNAWIEYDTLAAAIATTTVTTMTVNDADGDDPFGYAPRFSEGQLLQIDSEYIEVTKVNTASNALTIRRGVNGSTAATHSNGASVKVWQTDEPIRRAVARQAGSLLARRGAYQAESNEGGAFGYPPDLLSEVRGIIQDYQYV